MKSFGQHTLSGFSPPPHSTIPISVRDEFRSGGGGGGGSLTVSCPNILFHCLHKNQVDLPEYLSWLLPENGYLKHPPPPQPNRAICLSLSHKPWRSFFSFFLKENVLSLLQNEVSNQPTLCSYTFPLLASQNPYYPKTQTDSPLCGWWGYGYIEFFSHYISVKSNNNSTNPKCHCIHEISHYFRDVFHPASCPPQSWARSVTYIRPEKKNCYVALTRPKFEN